MPTRERSIAATALIAAILGTGLTTQAFGANRCVDALQTTGSDGIGGAIATAGQRLALESQHPPGKSDCDHYIVINSDGIKGETGYIIQAGQKIVQVEGVLDGYTVTGGPGDATQHNIAVGNVGGGTDGFVVWGPVEDIRLSNPGAAQVFVDGVQRPARPYNEHIVVIDSRNIPGGTAYLLEAGGYIEQVEGELQGWQVSIDPNDTVQGHRATGHVSTGVDGFRVYGPIETLMLDKPDAARVYVDGEERRFDPADIGARMGETLEEAFSSGDSSEDADSGTENDNETNIGNIGKRMGETLEEAFSSGDSSVNPDTGAESETMAGSETMEGVSSGAVDIEAATELIADNETSPGSFAGTWTTTFGELRLHRVGRFLIGDYAENGIILARVTGSCAAGMFTNGGRNGQFRFKLTDAEEFNGEWAWQKEPLNKNWNGKRTGPPPERLRNFTRDAGSTRTFDNDRNVYDGRYDSNYGELRLLSRDLFLIGKYADRGFLAGMWDGTSFVGQFTNGDRTGWFDFAFDSKLGTFRGGQWGWLRESGGGEWRLERVSTNGVPEPSDIAPDIDCS